MKAIISTSFFLLFLQILSFGQFTKGYIITNEDDTISGFINFEGSIINCTHCSFKSDLNGSTIDYAPGDIKAFRFIDSKFYITSEILINNTLQKVFLEWLIKGKASILSYSQSSLQSRYFLILENDSMFELKNSTKFEEINGLEYEIKKKEYIGGLTAYFKDCPQLHDEISQLPYSAKSFVKVSKKYHEITCGNEECVIFEDKHRKSIYSFGVTSGYINSRLRLRKDPLEFANISNEISAGVYFNISNLPLLSPNFSFQSGLYYLNTLYSYEYPELYPKIDDNRVIRVQSIKIPLMLKYKFLNKQLSPFIELGVTSNIRFSYKFYNDFLTNHITNHYNYYYKDILFFQVGVISGVGLEYVNSSNFGVNFRVDYELAPRFFGTYPNDETMNMNLIADCALFYRFNWKK